MLCSAALCFVYILFFAVEKVDFVAAIQTNIVTNFYDNTACGRFCAKQHEEIDDVVAITVVAAAAVFAFFPFSN